MPQDIDLYELLRERGIEGQRARLANWLFEWDELRTDLADLLGDDPSAELVLAEADRRVGGLRKLVEMAYRRWTPSL